MNEIIEVITELAEIVRELDPGKTRQYDKIAHLLEKARERDQLDRYRKDVNR